MFGARVLRKRHRKLPPVPRPGEVRVGFPAGKAPGDILDIAVWNHYGTRNIPERPFLDNAMWDNRAKYRKAMEGAARKLLMGETGMGTVLSRLGIMAQGDVQAEIVALRDPPNAASTIRQKGSSSPLIDTGRMRQSVTYEVRQ